jgi:hypothetical protein
VRVEALFRRRWWPCTTRVVEGVTVAVCAAGDVAAGVPLRVVWERVDGAGVWCVWGKFRAGDLADRLRERYADVAVVEERTGEGGGVRGG